MSPPCSPLHAKSTCCFPRVPVSLSAGPMGTQKSCWFLLGARDALVAAGQESAMALPSCCIVFKNRSIVSTFQHDAVSLPSVHRPRVPAERHVLVSRVQC